MGESDYSFEMENHKDPWYIRAKETFKKGMILSVVVPYILIEPMIRGLSINRISKLEGKLK